MRTLEILSAILAEELMRNGNQINLDPEEIIWPDGTMSKAPDHGGGPRGGRKKKNIPSSKNGVFGKIVNEYGPKNKTGVKPQSSTLVVRPQYQNNQEVQQQQQQQQDLNDKDAPKKGTFH